VTGARGARRVRTALVAAGLLLGLAACDEPRRPNILWVVWDTARADHLGLYGYARDTTPELDRWAAGARVFENCLSTAGYTLPSHASLFTGLLPSEHCADNDHTRLDDRYTTIAELLRSAGYRNYLYSANPHVSSAGNFDQGFDLAEHPWSPRFSQRAALIVRGKLLERDSTSELARAFERAERNEGRLSAWNIKAAGELAQQALLDWLDASDRRRPFFAFVNYMEAHRPLVPPRRYRERMMAAADVERSYEVDRSWLPTWEYTFGLREFDDRQIELTRATYDAALAELDDLFARLIQALQARGHLDDTIVVLTSDHGEHLGEQHMLDHQYSLYQPLLRVPLIVHYPARFPAGRDSRPVMHFDIFPTLLELAGVAPPVGLRSRAESLLEPPRPRTRLAEDPASSKVAVAMVRQSHPGWDPSAWQRRLRALFEGQHKLIWGSDGRHELYDLAADPSESSDLFGGHRELAARLQQVLDSYVESLQPCERAGTPAPELTPQEIERLQALGYLGG